MSDQDHNFNVAPPGNRNDNVVAFRQKKSGPAETAFHPPLLNMPEGTKILAFSLVPVHLILWASHQVFPEFPLDRIYFELGFVPARWTGSLPFGITSLLSLITFNFLHAGWFHLGMNVMTLVAFGAGIEKRIGAKYMLILFFATSILAAFTHLIFAHASQEPVVGASGGISGLFGAVLIVMKHDGRHVGLNQQIMPMAMIWIVSSIIFGIIGSPDGSSVAWIAHIGGFLAGLGLTALLMRKIP